MRAILLACALLCASPIHDPPAASVLAPASEGTMLSPVRLPAGASLVTSWTALVGSEVYLVAVFSNNTIASILIPPAGEGGLINLPDRAVGALPGASGEQVAATWNAIGVNPALGGEPDIVASYAPGGDLQGLSGSPHPVEVSYTYTTAAPPGSATIVVTVRGHNRNRVTRQLRNHVTAIQKNFPPQ